VTFGGDKKGKVLGTGVIKGVTHGSWIMVVHDT
jgi:hypothetical protein